MNVLGEVRYRRHPTRECIGLSYLILQDVDLGCHTLSKGTVARCDKLELDFEELFLHNGRDENLNLKVEHVILRDRFIDLKESLLLPTFVIIDEVTAFVPGILGMVEDFELDKCSRASFYVRAVLFSVNALLLRYVLDVRQIRDR